VGKLLADDIEKADLVARLSGDEFAVLVRDSDARGAIQTAAAMQTALNGLDLSFGGQSLRVSAGIGIVLFPTQADNIDDLLASADIALIQAKEKGFGHWHLFEEGNKTRERLRKRIYWRGEVARALTEDRFVLYFQPIMDIKANRISHYEVLLRMCDDQGNIIAPAQFIDTVERIGMIHEVDRLVVKKAIACMAELRDLGQDVMLAVNLSGRAFNDPQLLSHVRHELKQSQVDSSKLIFEITETAAVSDFAEAKSLMLAIKELGCKFALDDFGIGFSSFYYLKQLPVDYLKIDGSFIRHLAESFDDQIIVQAMSQVAAGFGKKTVAEFVETEVSLGLLRQYNIDYAQGYLIGKPQSAEDSFHLTHSNHALTQRI
jgi:EAL domain-containing protein (putative c-di-GMP-specific phosphodiesterase class I)